MTFGHGERLLVTFIMPIAGLILFSSTPIISTGKISRIDFFTPSVLAIAMISTAMVNLSIATGFERSWLVLKRLRSTPLSSMTLIVAKLVSVLIIEFLQVVTLVIIALGLGWHLNGNLGLAILVGLAGTTAFAGIGLAMAGTMRAEMVLAFVNGIYLVLIGISGIMFPLVDMGSFAKIARLLPSTALADALRGALTTNGNVPLEAAIVLIVWAIAAPGVAIALFRFE